jgi:hypothetical protein
MKDNIKIDLIGWEGVTGLIWLRIGVGGRSLVNTKESSDSIKILNVSRPPDQV